MQKWKKKRPDGKIETNVAPLIEIYIFSSNNQLIYTRKYSKIIDVFADVGGIAEVVGFFVLFLYAWYSSIKMEQKLLNYGVLNQSDLEEKEVLVNGGMGQISEKWEKSRYFTFCELIKFGLAEKNILCCAKNNKKYQLYLKCKETLETRTDIINVMKTVAEVDTIKEACFDDYQNRLTPYLVNQKEDDDSDLRQMTISTAIEDLKSNSRNETKPDIKKLLDVYLMKKLPKEILDDETEKLEIKNYRKGGELGKIFKKGTGGHESAIVHPLEGKKLRRKNLGRENRNESVNGNNGSFEKIRI